MEKYLLLGLPLQRALDMQNDDIQTFFWKKKKPFFLPRSFGLSAHPPKIKREEKKNLDY